MGWLSALADIGLGVAAPFTGGASLAAIPIANKAIAGLQGDGPNSTPPNDSSDGSDGSDGSGSILSSVLSGILGNNGQGASALGKGLGGVAQADASNRGTKIAALLAANQQQLNEQQQRYNDLATLPGQIQKADYLAGGGYKPAQNFSSNGRPIPHFDLGLKPIDANVQAAGSTLEKQLTDRLNNAPTYKDPTQYINPSATETALNWASPILSAAGASQQKDPTTALLQQLLKGNQTTPTSSVPQAPGIQVGAPSIPTQPPPLPPPVNPNDDGQ